MEASDETLETLFWRDEILQIMFWLRGEGIGEAVSPRDLLSFLGIAEDQARSVLEQMVETAFVEHLPETSDRYRLTEWGIQEGGRHFAEEFAGMTNQGHGECNDPNCACHTLGPQACEHHIN